ncbi:MAG TPA: YfhO family protein [Anaerolineales bacterium]
MALLVRCLGMRPLSQTISGLAFGMSGYLVARSGFLSINSAVAWLPWVILGVTNFVKSEKNVAAWKDAKIGGRRKELILLSVMLGLQLLSGHAQTTWYTLLLAGLWSAFLALSKFEFSIKKVAPLAKEDSELSAGYLLFGNKLAFTNRQGSFGIGNRLDGLFARIRASIGRITRVWAGIGLAVLLAIALACIQLFPTAEYLLQSQRASEVDYQLGMTYSFWPWRVITLIAPDMFGNPVRGDYWGYANYWEDANYSGLIPFLLAIGALIRGMRKKELSEDYAGLSRFLFALIIVSFLLALGSNTPIFPWLYRHIPTFDMFQAPTRFTIWAVFSFAILAGMGAHYWRKPSGKGLYWTRLGTAGAVAVAAGSGLAWYLMGDISPSFIRSTAMAGIWGVAAGALTLLAPKASLISGGLELKHNPTKISWWSAGVGTVICVDLIVAGWGLNPGIDMEVYAGKSTSGRQFVSDLGGGRLFVPEEVEYEIKFERFFRFDTFNPDEGWADLRSTLLPNMSLLDDLPSVNNFDPILNARYARWMEILNQSDEQTQDRLLNLMNVKVVERVDSSSPPKFNFALRDAFSRFRWVPCSRPANSGDQALQEVIRGGLSLEQVVILETNEESLDPDCQDVGVWNVERVSESHNNIVVRTSTSSPGYLVLADQWYPGWRAQLDGNEVEILRANFLFRAIQLPAGEHEIVMRYRPTWFYGGAIISLLTCVGMGWFFVKRT